MNRQEALREAAASLRKRHIPDARAEAEILLAHAAGMSRAKLYASLSDPVPEPELQSYRDLIARRAGGEPSAYLTEHKEFFGLDFYVDHRVLIPRPETELLVETALHLAGTRFAGRPLKIADIGAGSGAIAITLACHLPQAQMYGIEISPDALAVARTNAERHGVADRIEWLRGDLLGPLPAPVDIIVANLPYITRQDYANLPREIRDHEPKGALLGGEDGLDFVSRLLDQAPSKLRPGGSILLEIGPFQREQVSARATVVFPGATIEVLKDLAGLDRAVLISP